MANCFPSITVKTRKLLRLKPSNEYSLCLKKTLIRHDNSCFIGPGVSFAERYIALLVHHIAHNVAAIMQHSFSMPRGSLDMLASPMVQWLLVLTKNGLDLSPYYFVDRSYLERLGHSSEPKYCTIDLQCNTVQTANTTRPAFAWLTVHVITLIRITSQSSPTSAITSPSWKLWPQRRPAVQ